MCGIFGVSGVPDAARITFHGLYALQHRGQESAGIASVDGAGIARLHRGMGLVSETFSEAALSSLAGIAFIRYPKWGLMTGIILFLLCYPLGILPMWPKLARPSLDNIPFIPWVFFVLLGMNSTHILAKIKLPKIPQGEKLIFLSKHSLKIYLLHQPLMLALVFLFWKLLP